MTKMVLESTTVAVTFIGGPEGSKVETFELGV